MASLLASLAHPPRLDLRGGHAAHESDKEKLVEEHAAGGVGARVTELGSDGLSDGYTGMAECWSRPSTFTVTPCSRRWAT